METEKNRKKTRLSSFKGIGLSMSVTKVAMSLLVNEEVIDAREWNDSSGFHRYACPYDDGVFTSPERLATPFSFMYYKAAQYLKATLDAGVTSVRDALGTDLGVKKAVNEGLIPGPRLQLSINALTITGGHGDGYTVSGNVLDLLPSPYPGMPNGVCDGVEEVRKKTREMLRAGADVIKVHATGGVLSATDHPEFTQFSYEELKVIVEEGRFRKGVKVMAHAQGAEGIKNAVRAGVHSIEHGIFIDDEAIELMLENGTYLVPTLSSSSSCFRNSSLKQVCQILLSRNRKKSFNTISKASRKLTRQA